MSKVVKTEKQKFEGEYYTPKIWVDEIHKKMQEIQPDYLSVPTLDPAAGTRGLTRDYPYTALISSTLLPNEADVQWDYLNEMEPPKAVLDVMEQGVKECRFNVICNPPYGTAGNNKRDSGSKAGITDSNIRDIIARDKNAKGFGSNLATQFLYRVIKFYEDNPEITEGYVTWIAPPLFLSSSRNTELRNRLFSLFDFEYGFMIDAGEFAGIKKGQWSIGFMVLKLNRTKEVYNLDNNCNDLQSYIKINQSKRTELFPHFSSSLKIGKNNKYKMSTDAIAVFVNNGACIELNSQTIFLINGLPNANYGNVIISKKNFFKMLSGFSARRLIENNIWNSKDEYLSPASLKPVCKFKFDILENTKNGIVKTGEKEVYNLDCSGKQCSEWVRKPKIVCNIEYPQLSSPLKLTTTNKILGCKNILGYFVCDSNVPSENDSGVSIMSSLYSKNKGLVISRENFYKNINFFCCRRLTIRNVWNDKDEYMKPSDTILVSDEYKQWSNDCIIYSLFDNQSFQSSLRQVEYQSKKWDIKNEFFWLSKEHIKTLAITHSNTSISNDLSEDEERYVYQEIERIKGERITFSKEALDLLNYANQMVVDTFHLRESADPSWHLNSWDAGYAQIKLLMTKKQKDEFGKLRKALADKLMPKVYYFGFLYDPKYKHWTDDLPLIAEIDGELYDFVNDEGVVLTRGVFESIISNI